MEGARLIAETMGNEVEGIVDVGVAGIHRLLHQREKLMDIRVVVVCTVWKARCRARSVEWYGARLLRYQPASAMGRASTA